MEMSGEKSKAAPLEDNRGAASKKAPEPAVSDKEGAGTSDKAAGEASGSALVLSSATEKIFDVWVGMTKHLIRGARFYHDNYPTHRGDHLILKREPYNDYDKNAITIFNDGNRVGYIKRELAEVLAPFIDEKDIVLTADARGDGPPWNGVLHIDIWTYENSGITREHMGICVKLARIRPEDDSGETTDY